MARGDARRLAPHSLVVRHENNLEVKMNIKPFAYFSVLVLCLMFGVSTQAVEITNNLGHVYKNASIIRIEPDGLSIKHEGGIAKLFFSELPPDMQEKYGYDPAKATQYRQRAMQAQQQHHAQVRQASAPLQSQAFPVHLYDIIAVKDKSVKKISGISAYLTDMWGNVHLRPVAGGLYRIRFSVRNNTGEDMKIQVKYGDYIKEVFISANSRKEGEEISGLEKYSEIFIKAKGQEKAFTFTW